MDDKNEAFVSFTTDDGDIIDFRVLEQTTIAGKNYLLVEDTQEDGVCYIMREVSIEDEDMVSYEFVEEDMELKSISKVFEELLEDTDIVE